MITEYSDVYYNECKRIYDQIYIDNLFSNKIHFIKENSFNFYILKEGKNIIGYSAYNTEYTTAIIYLLTLDKKFQNKSYGSELLNHILYEISKDKTIKTITIKTHNKEFLEKNGFVLLFDLGYEYYDRYIMEMKIRN